MVSKSTLGPCTRAPPWQGGKAGAPIGGGRASGRPRPCPEPERLGARQLEAGQGQRLESVSPSGNSSLFVEPFATDFIFYIFYRGRT
jgi:hypothetical protein